MKQWDVPEERTEFEGALTSSFYDMNTWVSRRNWSYRWRCTLCLQSPCGLKISAVCMASGVVSYSVAKSMSCKPLCNSGSSLWRISLHLKCFVISLATREPKTRVFSVFDIMNPAFQVLRVEILLMLQPIFRSNNLFKLCRLPAKAMLPDNENSSSEYSTTASFCATQLIPEFW